MPVNSITGNVAASTLKSLTTADSLHQPLAVASAINDQPPNPTMQSRVVGAKSDDTVSPANNQSLNADSENHTTTARTMSHVVEVYNLHGKVRIKFMDSHNNVIYQIPSEMVAKVEDQMMKPETSANTKG